jgi:hypothetical protein
LIGGIDLPAKTNETTATTETTASPKLESKAPKLVEVKLNVEHPAEKSSIRLVSGRVEFVSGVATVTDATATELKSAGYIK